MAHGGVLFLKDFIYLFDRERDSQREREHKQGGVGEEEAGSQGSRQSDMGLDPSPRTPGSRPEPKADA